MVYRGWRYIDVSSISRAVYQGWRYIKVGGISRLAVYRGWRYIEIVKVNRRLFYLTVMYKYFVMETFSFAAEFLNDFLIILLEFKNIFGMKNAKNEQFIGEEYIT